MEPKYFTRRKRKYFFAKNIKQILNETDFKINDFQPYIPIKRNIEEKNIKVFY